MLLRAQNSTFKALWASFCREAVAGKNIKKEVVPFWNHDFKETFFGSLGLDSARKIRGRKDMLESGYRLLGSDWNWNSLDSS